MNPDAPDVYDYEYYFYTYWGPLNSLQYDGAFFSHVSDGYRLAFIFPNPGQGAWDVIFERKILRQT